MSNSPRFRLLPSGFHGDIHLQSIVQVLLRQVEVFVETGSNVGSTLLYVARTHPTLECLSCEPDKEARDCAVANTAGCPNVSIFAGDSQSFFSERLLPSALLQHKSALFWLDAHCYGFKWPLETELAFIAQHFGSAWILIDDCAVPDRPEFAFHSAPGELCTLATVSSALPPGAPRRVWYPAYSEHTSPWHPLTGWCLVAIGDALQSADELIAKLPAGLVAEYRPQNEVTTIPLHESKPKNSPRLVPRGR